MRDSYKVMILTIAGFFGQLFSILAGVFLVRFFTKEDYGLFRQVFLVTDTFVYIFSVCIPASLLYFFPKMSKNEKKGFLLQTIFILSILGTIGSILTFALTPFISVKFNNPEIRNILYFFSFYIFFQIIIQFISPMLMGINKYKQASLIQFVISFLRMFCIVICVVLGLGVYDLMIVIFIYTIIQAIIVVLFALNYFKGIAVKWNKDLIKKQLSYALPLGTASIVWFIGKEIDKYFLSIFFTQTHYAIYAVGALEIPIFREVSTAISSVLIPKMSALYSENKKEELLKIWKETIRKCMLIFLPAFGLLFLVSSDLIATLYTVEYMESVVIFKIYLCLILLRIFNPNVILQSIGKTKIIMVCAVLFVIVNIALSAFFITVLDWGITGPAIATIISYVVMLSINQYSAMIYIDVSFMEIFPLKDFMKIAVSVSIAYFGSFYTMPVIPNSFLNGMLLGASFSIIFLAMGWYLKFFTKDDIDLVFDKFKKISGNR